MKFLTTSLTLYSWFLNSWSDFCANIGSQTGSSFLVWCRSGSGFNFSPMPILIQFIIKAVLRIWHACPRSRIWIFPSWISDLDFSIPDRIRNPECIFTQKFVTVLSELWSEMFIADHVSGFFHYGSRIQWSKSTGSRIRIRNTASYWCTSATTGPPAHLPACLWLQVRIRFLTLMRIKMWIRIRSFTLIRIRIWLLKMMPIPRAVIWCIVFTCTVLRLLN